MTLPRNHSSQILFAALLLVVTVGGGEAAAAQLTLKWTDTSAGEKGFKIERKAGTAGTFAQIAAVGANVVSFVDADVAGGTTYCYRVRAYNTAGDSPYSNQDCGAAAADTQPPAVALTAPQKSATVSGSASPVSASASDNVGVVGVRFRLDGANLGSEDTVAPYSATWNTTTVANGSHTLTAVARDAAGNTTTSTAVVVTVKNNAPPPNHTLTVKGGGTGGGVVSSSPGGISCGTDCTQAYPGGTVVALKATPAPGSTFGGWSGGGCSGTGPCSVTLSAATSVAATFNSPAAVRVGVFRPSTGKWYLDLNGNGVWDDGAMGGAVGPFGGQGRRAVVGDWSGAGAAQIGVFDPATGLWKLDRNGNDHWDGCTLDLCLGPFTEPGDLPIVGRWKAGAHVDAIGVFHPDKHRWVLDLDGNGHHSGCGYDGCSNTFTKKTNKRPVAGDWTGSGVTKIGAFSPATGLWRLDRNGNRTWDGCVADGCLGPFGIAGDLPVVGDWDGTGRAKIGVFDPATGMWELDRNGNGTFDGCSVDACLGPFGQQGDLPVIGRW